MRFIASGASVIGPRHIDQHGPNQDAMTLSGWRGGWIAAVADGLGSRSHSDVGARSACQVSRKILRQAPYKFVLSELLPKVHQEWLKSIRPLHPRDVATTLLFARVMSSGDVHASQLGDGLMLTRFGGEFRCMTRERSAFGNQTSALELNYVPDRWTSVVGRLSNPGDGIVLMTDGVADDIHPAHLADFFDALYHDMKSRNRRRGRRWLQSELKDWATPLHSDDKTVVAIFRTCK